MNKFFTANTHHTFPIDNAAEFKRKAFRWASQFATVCYLDNNEYQGGQDAEFEGIIAVGISAEVVKFTGDAQPAFEKLKSFWNQKKDWLFGFLAYDLKNEVEKLNSANFDGLGFPEMHFFQPQCLIEVFKRKIRIQVKNQSPWKLFQDIIHQPLPDFTKSGSQISVKKLSPRIEKAAYLKTVETIRQHIIKGDIYEMNFCQEFFAENVEINPYFVFSRLNELSKAPFSTFYKHNNRYLLCSSPERFIKKNGKTLISQPIKGTITRGKTQQEDLLLADQLFNSQKDRSENVMIVDLVRNDLSKSCRPGTVKVDELFGIYPFEQVFQMISTVKGELREDVHFVDAIRDAFPMGSMTGAPKIRSMQLIEQYEKTKRGLYSGAVGYIKPNGDFDFNVVIRSLLYHSTKRYLSLQVGGAIVFDSKPEDEYEECLLKAKAMFEVLGVDQAIPQL